MKGKLLTVAAIIGVLFAGAYIESQANHRNNTSPAQNTIYAQKTAANNTTTNASTTNTTANTTTTKSSTTKTSTIKNTTTTTTQTTQQTPDWKRYTYKWTADDGTICTIYFDIDMNQYKYYAGLKRMNGAANLTKYASEAYQLKIYDSIIKGFKDIQKQMGYSNGQIAREMINFVAQCFDYQYDIDGKGVKEWYKYPIETLVEGRGDCEDTSILLAGLLHRYNMGVAFVHLPGHVAVAIKGEESISGTYYNYKGGRYYYVETTGDSATVGWMPEQYKSQTADLYGFN